MMLNEGCKIITLSSLLLNRTKFLKTFQGEYLQTLFSLMKLMKQIFTNLPEIS